MAVPEACIKRGRLCNQSQLSHSGCRDLIKFLCSGGAQPEYFQDFAGAWLIETLPNLCLLNLLAQVEEILQEEVKLVHIDTWSICSQLFWELRSLADIDLFYDYLTTLFQLHMICSVD
jgi:hypothetical protein